MRWRRSGPAKWFMFTVFQRTDRRSQPGRRRCAGTRPAQSEILKSNVGSRPGFAQISWGTNVRILDLVMHTFGHVESMNLVAGAFVQEVLAQFRAARTARTLVFPLYFFWDRYEHPICSRYRSWAARRSSRTWNGRRRADRHCS